MNQAQPTGLPPYWQAAVDQLCARDPKFAELVQELGDVGGLSSKGTPWLTLARSIVSQQISVSAANSIWARVEALIPEVDSQELLQASTEDLRACGLSQRKVEYLRTAAEWCQQQSADFLAQAPWAEVRAELMRLRGVGNWTCQMFAMFYRMEPDEFPLGDIGLQRALKQLYDIDIKQTADQRALEDLSTLWQPYRTVATWYLWRAIDPVPIAY